MSTPTPALPIVQIDVSPCADNGTETSVVARDEAQFWTVYVRREDETLRGIYPAEAVLDCATEKRAVATAFGIAAAEPTGPRVVYADAQRTYELAPPPDTFRGLVERIAKERIDGDPLEDDEREEHGDGDTYELREDDARDILLAFVDMARRATGYGQDTTGWAPEECDNTDCPEETHLMPQEGLRVRLLRDVHGREPGTDGTYWNQPAGAVGTVVAPMAAFGEVHVVFDPNDAHAAATHLWVEPEDLTTAPETPTWPRDDEERAKFADWQREASEGDTLLGFRDWLAANA